MCVLARLQDEYLINFDSCLGEGIQGQVYEAVHCKSGEICIAKVTYFARDSQRKAFMNECRILTTISHCKSVVEMKKWFLITLENGSECGVFILEKYPTDLMSLLEDEELCSKEKLNIFKQVSQGIDEIHANGVAHLDIKPENILVSADRRTIKLIDFGNAQILPADGLVTSSGGTMVYTAPETLQGGNFNGKFADIWSLGILFHVLISSHWPYPQSMAVNLRTQVASGLLSIHDSLSKSQEKAFRKMCQLDPNNRAVSFPKRSTKSKFKNIFVKPS